jgi:Iap family predicted aminopeptidase
MKENRFRSTRPRRVVKHGDKLGQRRVNNVPPPIPISADSISLAHAAFRAQPKTPEPREIHF